MATSSLHRRGIGELDSEPEPDDILDPDDVAAELLGDADEPPTTSMSRTPRRTRALDHGQAPNLPPSAAGVPLATKLRETEAELTRVRRHMRARDAYLAELEQALRASTSKLEASGIGSIQDAHKLFGRLRGQAFRIAELESELRHMQQRLAHLSRLLPTGSTG